LEQEPGQVFAIQRTEYPAPAPDNPARVFATFKAECRNRLAGNHHHRHYHHDDTAARGGENTHESEQAQAQANQNQNQIRLARTYMCNILLEPRFIAHARHALLGQKECNL